MENSIDSIKISYYNNVTDTTGSVLYVKKTLELIKKETFRSKIIQLRAFGNKKEREKFKKDLPCVTWSGTFAKREKKQIINHSGIICLDIDQLENPEETRKTILEKRPPFLLAAFISPSGNGLKILCRVNINPFVDLSNLPPQDWIPQRHEIFWKGLAIYFQKNFGLTCDPSGIDVCRLCFLSADANMYIADEKELTPFTIEDVINNIESRLKSKKETESNTNKNESTTNTNNTEEIIEWCKNYTDKIIRYGINNRNNYIYRFCRNLNLRGIHQSEAEKICFQLFSDYAEEDSKGMIATIKSAYTHHTHEFGTWKNYQPKKS